MRILARPRHLGSTWFELTSDAGPFGELQVRWLRRRAASMTVDYSAYDLVWVGGGRWELRRQGLPDVVARFGRTRPLSHRHEILWDGHRLEIRRIFPRLRLHLFVADEEVGWVRPRRPFLTSLEVELPAGLPSFVAGLVVWAAVRMRRAES